MWIASVFSLCLLALHPVYAQLPLPSQPWLPPNASVGTQSSNGTSPNQQWSNVVGNLLYFYEVQRSSTALELVAEGLGAAVVLREGMSCTERELRDFAAKQLADFKVPRKVVFLPEIPKGATGKLQRIGLAEKLGISA